MNSLCSDYLFNCFCDKNRNCFLSSFTEPLDLSKMETILSQSFPFQGSLSSGESISFQKRTRLVFSQNEGEKGPAKKRFLERKRKDEEEAADLTSVSSFSSCSSSSISSYINQQEVIERVQELKNIDILFSEKNIYYDNLVNNLIHTAGYQDDIDNWERSILRNGISDRIDVVVQGRQSSIYNKEPLKKGAFVGAFAGSIGCQPLSEKKSILFAYNTKANFYLNRTNILQDLPISNNGNVRLKIVYNPGTRQLHFVLLARKNIPARTNLVLQEVAPIRI